MPAVIPLRPAAIKKLLEAKGYKLIGADEFNWAFALGDHDEPVFVPIMVEFVPIEVAFNVARKVGFNNYFAALDAEAEPFPPDDAPSAPAARPS